MFGRIRLPDSLGEIACPLADSIALQLLRFDAERLRDTYRSLHDAPFHDEVDAQDLAAAHFFLAHPMLLLAGLVAHFRIEGHPAPDAASLWTWLASPTQSDHLSIDGLQGTQQPRDRSRRRYEAGLAVAKALRGFRPWRKQRVGKGSWPRQLARLLRKGCGWRRGKARKLAAAALSKPFARTLSTANESVRSDDGWWLRVQVKEIGVGSAAAEPQQTHRNGTAHAGGDAAAAQRLQTAKLESLRRLAYGASHELNNPLANIAMRAQTLLRGEACPERRKKLQTIEQQALRAHEMISDLMLFAHPPQPKFDLVDLAELAGSVAREIEPRARSQEISIDVIADDSFTQWSIDVTQFAEALRALIKNSMESIGQRGAIVIELRRSGAEARIFVRDSGPGIDEAVAAHVFDPFYSGREAGRGLGFGLSKAWCIARMHGGQLECVDTAAGQATFLMLLPQSQPAAIA